MTPTSATGSPDKRPRRAGFTLVELLITVAIMGMAAGAVVLTIPDPRPAVSQEAETFAAKLTRAREEAILSNRAVAVEIDRTGYAFRAPMGARGWQPLTEGPFQRATWDKATAVSLTQPVQLIVFDPTGAAEPARLVLERDGRQLAVDVDAAGEVVLK